MKNLSKTLLALVVGGMFYECVHGQSRMVLDGGVVLNIAGGSASSPSYVVLDNGHTNAVTASGGSSINSEGEYNRLRWHVENGTGTYSVPLADVNNESVSITLNITTAGSSDGYIDFSTYPTLANNLPLPNGVSSIAHTNPNLAADGSQVFDRFWIVNADSYSAKPEGTMNVKYNQAGMSGGLDFGLSELKLQMFNTNTGEWMPSLLGVDNLNGTISNIPLSDAAFFPIFTLVQSSSALPITLLNFNAIWGDERETFAKIFWSTASEQNNDFFDVERSSDGVNWQEIGQIQGAGNSNTTLNYLFNDMHPLIGVSYYRLKQVDYDGTVTNSHIVSLKREIQEASIGLFPNPANNSFNIYFFGFQSETVELNILDNAGRTVCNLTPNIEANPEQKIDAESFQSGVYHIHVRSENYVITKKIMIIK